MTSQFSVSFWMKSTKTSGLQVVAGNNTDFVNNTARAGPSTRTTGISTSNSTAGDGLGIGVLQASDLNTQVCNGQWENVVVTYDGSEEASGLGISIDGAAPQTLDTPSHSGLDSLGVTSGDPTIGATPAPGNYFYGDLNKLHLNRVLAPPTSRRSTPVERATTARAASPAWWPATTWTTPRPLLSPTTREMETTAPGTATRLRCRPPAKFSAR